MPDHRCHLILPPEWRKRDNERREQSLPASGYWKPGDMWFAPWLHNPQDAGDTEALARDRTLAEEGKTYLSAHYYRDWAGKRPPIMVMLPDGLVWCVDSCNRRAGGWRVTGDAPAITCEPSIATISWHGWLRQGILSDA